LGCGVASVRRRGAFRGAGVGSCGGSGGLVSGASLSRALCWAWRCWCWLVARRARFSRCGWRCSGAGWSLVGRCVVSPGPVGARRPGRFSLWRCVVSASAGVVRPLVGVCGSRGLPSSSRSGGLVSSVVASVAASRRGLAVGCCVGADAAALSARLRLGFRSAVSGGPALSVFAAFGPGGVGSWSGGSAVGLVARAASLASSPGHGVCAPVSVRWWAGGGSSVPLRSRLASRSSALVSAVAASAASGPGAGLVAFVLSGRGGSVGSWRAVRLALASGLPVVVFPVVRWLSRPAGWRPSVAQERAGLVGCFPCSFRGVGRVRWVPAASSGVWSLGVRPVVG